MTTIGAARSLEGPATVHAAWQAVGPDGALGELCDHDFSVSFGLLRHLHRQMVVGRRLDRQAITLTRQGMLGVYASSRGQEACQVGAAAALAPDDWLFPTYRDSVAAWARGVEMAEVLALFVGSWHCGFDPRTHRVAPLCTPLATHLAHAVGVAMAAKLRGDPVVALAMLGDGAASEGDTHEAMNIAGVTGAPCVFVIQNNQYAISVPLRLQTATTAMALRAAGYGMPGVLVDGNDVISVYAGVREAVERARSGGGPTLIEARTYRIEPHTTADDPTRYRSDDEVATWAERDPLERLRRLLLEQGVIDEDAVRAVDAEAEAAAAALRDQVQSAAAGDPLEMFDQVRATLSEQLRAQRSGVAAILAAERELG